MLGSFKCEASSVIDFKDTFHSLRLTEELKKYCWILPYFSSASYLYHRKAMGLHILLPYGNHRLIPFYTVNTVGGTVKLL